MIADEKRDQRDGKVRSRYGRQGRKMSERMEVLKHGDIDITMVK